MAEILIRWEKGEGVSLGIMGKENRLDLPGKSEELEKKGGDEPKSWQSQRCVMW